jgi:hypothetical protein
MNEYEIELRISPLFFPSQFFSILHVWVDKNWKEGEKESWEVEENLLWKPFFILVNQEVQFGVAGQ